MSKLQEIVRLEMKLCAIEAREQLIDLLRKRITQEEYSQRIAEGIERHSLAIEHDILAAIERAKPRYFDHHDRSGEFVSTDARDLANDAIDDFAANLQREFDLESA